MTEVVRWGFLGAGWIAGRALAPAVHASDATVLQAAAARAAERAVALEPRGRAYDDYDDLLADPSVEVVYISLANHAHVQWTLAALHAGKHVLCEKPLGLNNDEVGLMTEAARAAGRLLVEASWYRWHPRVRAAEQMVAEGALGTVRRVEAGFCFDSVASLRAGGNYRLDPDAGGGALYDVGCYAASAALWATGWPDAEVLDTDVLRAVEGVDLSTRARLRLGAAEAVLHVSLAEAAGQWLRVTGTQGVLELPGESFTAWRDQPTVLLRDGAEMARFDPVDAYRLMVEAVSAATRGESAWVVPLEQSAAVASALDAVRAHETSVGSGNPPGTPGGVGQQGRASGRLVR